MLSQLTKTIKMALKSTEEERAMLRARSAVQRFPVVEWRQRTEDFHKRSITMSRDLAGSNAWRSSDCQQEGPRNVIGFETEDWDPVHQSEPSQPNWDSRSMNDSPHVSTPGSPGQWSQDTLTPFDGRADQAFLSAPPRMPSSDDHSRRGSMNSEHSDNEDYFSQARSGASHDTRSTLGSGGQPQQGFDNFLARANKQIAKDSKHVADPFLDAANAAPTRPFGAHSRVSSVESISSIVDEKVNSPLNKAIASVRRAIWSFRKLVDMFYPTVHGFRW